MSCHKMKSRRRAAVAAKRSMTSSCSGRTNDIFLILLLRKTVTSKWLGKAYKSFLFCLARLGEGLGPATPPPGYIAYGHEVLCQFVVLHAWEESCMYVNDFCWTVVTSFKDGISLSLLFSLRQWRLFYSVRQEVSNSAAWWVFDR